MESFSHDSLRIAPKRDGGHWTVQDYRSIDFSTEGGWQLAIDIFEDRIRGRFLDIVAQIEDHPYSGFAVMALDCLLIETLQQFREGVTETPRGKSKEYFVNFLRNTRFKEHLKTEDMAERFYDWIRCGILHQAEIKGSSRIVTRESVPLVAYTDDRNGLIINRRKFHALLVKVFEEYIEDLRSAPMDSEIRQNFKRKMDFICKIA